MRFSAAGLIPARLVAATSLFALVEFVAGTLLGARWYTEVEEVPW